MLRQNPPLSARPFNGLDSFLRFFLRNSSQSTEKSAAARYLDYSGISVAKLSIYKYVRTDKGWRYCKAAFHLNGKIKSNVVSVRGWRKSIPREGSLSFMWVVGCLPTSLQWFVNRPTARWFE